MALLRYFRKSPFIGLDLGGTAATFIQLQSKAQSWRIEKYAQLPIPALWINDHIQCAESEMSALKECVERLKLRNAKTAVALPLQCVISKRIKSPLDFDEIMDETERMDYLKPYLTGRKEDFYMDYSIKKGLEGMDSSMMLFAAKPTVIESIKQFIHAIGLQLAVVDVSAYALSRGAMAWLQTLNVAFKRVAILCLSLANQLIYIDYPEVVFVHDLTSDGHRADLHQAMIDQMKAAFQWRLIEWEKIEALVVIDDNQAMKAYQQSLEIPCFSCDRTVSVLTSIGLALRGRGHD